MKISCIVYKVRLLPYYNFTNTTIIGNSRPVLFVNHTSSEYAYYLLQSSPSILPHFGFGFGLVGLVTIGLGLGLE